MALRVLVVAWCVFTTPKLSFAQDSLFTVDPVWFSGPSHTTRDVSFGDVDSDGDLDIVFGNFGDGNTLYLNQGGTFSRSPYWSSGAENPTWGVALGDVDGDGDLDLVCANVGYSNPGVTGCNTLYLNRGGTFSPLPDWCSIPMNDTYDVALGDVDGDGDLDLVCGNGGQKNTLYLNQGGTFSSQPDWLSGPANYTRGVALGDVDGDGDLDLVCGNGPSISGFSNTLYLNQGGTFSSQPDWSSGPANQTEGVALGDVDGDGDLDLVCGNDGQENTLYLNQGGTFSLQPDWFAMSRTRTRDVALGDVDGDGDLDLVCGNDGQEGTLYLNQGGTFSGQPDWTGETESPLGIALGDVDSDGDLDLVCGNNNLGNTLYLNLRRAFPPQPDRPFGTAYDTRGVALGDVDGDGDLDLVCGNYGENNTLFRNQGDTFSALPDWFSMPANNTWDVALGDIDRDGDLDLVCGNDGQKNALYLNEGGTFSSQPDSSWGLANDTRSIALGDVDGDGDLDLVCGNWAESNTLYLNQGNTFSLQPDWSSGWSATESVALGDVDGDGDLDLVCGNDGSSNTLYLNQGGTFSSQPDWSSIPRGRTHDVALGDVDGDGDLDLVCGSAFSANTLYINNGGTFFLQPDWSGSSNNSEGIDLGDVDGDGDLDLVCGNAQLAYVGNTLYLNQDGTFPPQPDWSGPVASHTQSVALGDVDGDGDLDLVCGNGNRDLSGGLRFENTIYKGRKDPVFQGNSLTPINQLPNNPGHVRSASLGQLDANTIRVYFAAVDVESDPIWIVPEYQFEGDPIWIPIEVEGMPGRVLHLTSPGGVVDSLDWDVTVIPFDSRDLVLRLRTIEVPKQVSLIQHAPSYLKNVGQIPRISVRAMPRSGTEFLQGRDVVIELLTTLPRSVVAMRLFVRRGGEPQYEEIMLQDGAPHPFAIIPGESIGPRGLEYWAEVQTVTSTLTDPPVNPSQNPHAVRVTVFDLQEPGVHAGGRYRLLSIPLELEPPLTILRALGDNLGFQDDTRWRLFGHDVDRAEYVKLPNDSIESFEVGRGYWLITRGDHRLDTAPTIGLSVPTDAPYVIDLKPGFNLLGNPFDFLAPWHSATVDGFPVTTTRVDGPWRWMESEGRYNDLMSEPVEVLVPFEGYWVKNLTDSVLALAIPTSEPPGGLAKSSVARRPARPSASAWMLQIAASSGGIADPGNYAGVMESAQSQWDLHDRAEPPVSPGRSLSLHFPHAEWNTHRGLYSIDIRGAYETLNSSSFGTNAFDGALEGHIWRFDVAKNFSDETAGDAVLLKFSSIESVPEEALIYLVDRHLDRLLDLREERQYSFYQGERELVHDDQDARFLLLIGGEDFMATHGDQLPAPPAHNALLQNYPNPFNPSTIIQYELANSGRVSLRVYDVSGALVRILEERNREPGRYEVGWNGDSERGARVASGVYFYRLTAPGFTQTRKMVLLK